MVSRLGFEPECILVNDGSTQTLSPDALQQLQQQLSHFVYTGYEQNQGKGAALRQGVAVARGKTVIYTDVDFPYTAESLIKVWQNLEAGADVVIGIKDAGYYKNVPRVRIRISKFLRKLNKFFLNIPVTDTQCGLKGFNAAGKSVFLDTTIERYLCDLEFIYKAYKVRPPLHIKVQEVQLNEDVQFRKMNYRFLLTEGWNFFKLLLRK